MNQNNIIFFTPTPHQNICFVFEDKNIALFPQVEWLVSNKFIHKLHF